MKMGCTNWPGYRISYVSQQRHSVAIPLRAPNQTIRALLGQTPNLTFAVDASGDQ